MSELKMRVVGMEWMRAGDILPHPENWREHSDEQKDAFNTMMEGVGFAGALLTFTLPNGDIMLIDGHLRSDELPDEMLPVLMTDLTEDEARELLATHDPLAALATANKARLKVVHSKLNKVTGRRAALLKKFRQSHGVVLDDEQPADDPGAQVDRAAELQEKWQVQRGDVWTIGKHRIMCGDSTCADDVEKLMGGRRADAVVTDPPYGIGHDTNYQRFTGGIGESTNFGGAIANDEESFDPLPLLKYKTVILWGANCYSDRLPLGSFLVWDKRNQAQEKLLSDGEIGWLNRGHGTYIFNHAWNGFLRDSERGKTMHPTQKPVDLFVWCFRWVDVHCAVFDPYTGSGPVIAACEQTNRIGYGMEIAPEYVAVCLERLAGMGLSPQRAIE